MSVIYLVIGWILSAIYSNYWKFFGYFSHCDYQKTSDNGKLLRPVPRSGRFSVRGFFSFHSRISATQCLFVMIAYVGFYRGNLP